MPRTVVDPDRFHWYVNPGALLHAPVTALSVSPNTAAPVMVGVGAVANVAEATVAVATLDLLVVRKPVLVAVTVTVRVLPMSAAPKV